MSLQLWDGGGFEYCVGQQEAGGLSSQKGWEPD